MKRRTKAKIKNSIITLIVFVAVITYFISASAIAEGFYIFIIPLVISGCLLWLFGEANKDW